MKKIKNPELKGCALLVRGFVKQNKTAFMAAAVFFALAAAVGISEARGSSGQGIVTRRAAGGSDTSMTFSYITEDGSENELTIDVSAIELEAEEAELLLEEAAAQWEEVFLGENESADQVKMDLYFPESLIEGMVEISYQSSDYSLIDAGGSVLTENLPQEGAQVMITAEFSCGDYSMQESRYLYLVWPDEGSSEWIYLKLLSTVKELEESSRLSETFSLPDSVEGYSITWTGEGSSSWQYFLIIGAAVFICFVLRDKENEKKAKKERQERLAAEYPAMVEQISLLLGSGMSIRHAWERIIKTYRLLKQTNDKYEDRIYIEEMEITLREIEGGWPEKAAYERFGSRIGLIPYRRFSSLLSQNISKGSQDIRALLKAEAGEAMEMRKNHARKLGEEASSKLLFPMMVIFVLLIAVLMVPALMSLQ